MFVYSNRQKRSRMFDNYQLLRKMYTYESKARQANSIYQKGIA